MSAAIRLTAVAAAALAAFASSPSVAQRQGIAATVNQDIITQFDLNARIKLALASLRVPDRPQFRRRIAPQVLRQLITEQLQIQEARRLKLTVTRQEIEKVIRNIERQRGLPRGGFRANVRRAGIPIRTVLRQIHANLAWNKVILRAIRPQIRVTEGEVEEVLGRNVANRNRVQYRISEIYLPVPSASREGGVLRTARQIMGQLRRGAPFNNLARQFSASSTAAVGGDRGVVFEGQLRPALRRAVKRMRPGQVAGPIRTITGYYIIQLHARGKLVSSGASFAQAGWRFQRNTPPATRRKARDTLRRLRRTAATCNAFVRQARSAGASFARVSANANLNRLAPPIRRQLRGLGPGGKTKIIGNRALMVVMMRCKPQKGGLPDRKAVRRSIVLQKVTVRARNYLRDLRRAAIVEIRV